MNDNKQVLNCKLKRSFFEFLKIACDGTGKVTTKFVTDMMFGFLTQQKSLISEIARSLKEDKNILYTVKRLSRNLSKDNEEYDMLTENILILNNSGIKENTIISVDGGDINRDSCLKMENISKIHDGSENRIAYGYNLNSIVATNILNEGKTIGGFGSESNLEIIPLILELYSVKDRYFESQNRQTISLIDRLTSIIGDRGIYIFDRGYDRERGIINELLERNLKFQIRAVGTRNVIDSRTGEKISLKKLADKTNTHKRVMSFPYKIDKKDSKIKGKIGFSKFKIPGSPKELTLCVLKKYSNEIAMMIITNLDIKDRTDIVKIFANYSLRWSIEDTYKYIKQEFSIEKLQLKKYESIKNIVKFIFLSMSFVSYIKRFSGKYLPTVLFNQAKNLRKNLKYKEHAIISGIRSILSINSTGIREYFRKIIYRLQPPGQYCLFDNGYNPYEILGKL